MPCYLQATPLFRFAFAVSLPFKVFVALTLLFRIKSMAHITKIELNNGKKISNEWRVALVGVAFGAGGAWIGFTLWLFFTLVTF